MGNRAVDLIKTGKKVLLAFEESIGYMCSPKVFDKDGVSASAIVAEMAVYLNQHEERTLVQKLDWIYEQYGYHVCNNSYYLCYQPAMVEKMFKRLRHFHDLESDKFTVSRALF
jgi:phosphomannomutase